jgi:hypothetical protein
VFPNLARTEESGDLNILDGPNQDTYGLTACNLIHGAGGDTKIIADAYSTFIKGMLTNPYSVRENERDKKT